MLIYEYKTKGIRMANNITLNINTFVDSLDSLSRDALYRRLWIEYVTDDIASHIETFDYISCDDRETIIELVAQAYVYDGDYDCNLTYWENIDNLISRFATMVVDEKERANADD